MCRSTMDDIKVSLEKQGNFEVLEVNIVMPEAGSRL
jgi:cell division topological specificity factor